MQIEDRIEQLERRVRWLGGALIGAGLAAAGLLIAAAAPRVPASIDARAIRIVDADGKARILIGAPTPQEGRVRQDAQTASIVVLGPDGRDRVIVGEGPTR